jgi:hypothetical protein
MTINRVLDELVFEPVALNLIAERLRNQRLRGARCHTPEEVVSWLGAVQAQEYPDARWALALRMEHATAAAIERAFAEGRILRTHVLRPTWHFVVPGDIRWMLALTGPCVSRRMAPYHRRLELDAGVFGRSQRAMVRALRGGVHLTRQELKTVLQRAGIRVDSGQHLAHLVMQAELDAVVCSGPPRGRQFTYALFDERVPASRHVSRDDALAELGRRYFTSHGPAQLRDFAWWSGLSVADARAGLATIERDLARETIDGKTYWFASTRGVHRSGRGARLLPLYDEYLIAYKDRSAALDRSLWTWGSGDPFSAAVLIDGEVVGTWRRRLDRGRVVVTVTPFASFRTSDVRHVSRAATAYAEFVGLDIELLWCRPKNSRGRMS